MINAKITHENGQIIDFEMTGHADFAEYGSDIVCAAVSVLTISTVNGLTAVANVAADVDMDDENGGFMHVIIPSLSDEKQRLQAQAILQTFEKGLLDVTAQYGQYIQTAVIN